MADFKRYLEDGIKSANDQILQESVAHARRVEFWKGYVAAMEEILTHKEWWPGGKQGDE